MKRFVFIALLLLSNLIQAQCLNEKVNIKCTNCTLEEVLDKLEAKVSCSFSYNASRVGQSQLISIDLQDVTLKKALEDATNGEFTFKQRGRHLLFVQKNDVREGNTEKKRYIIEGYVRNAATGQIVERATVYAIDNKYSALTNEQGFYQLSINTDKEFVGLSYSKQLYFDTILIVKPAEELLRQDIVLAPRAPAPTPIPRKDISIPDRKRNVEELPIVQLLVPQVQAQRAVNFEFYEQIPFQFSLIPSFGTNRLTSGNKENILSINLTSGYNAGVKGMEVGGLVNIDRKNVQGIQAGGIGNIVGGKVRGLQAGGIFNNVRGSIIGGQIAGVYNIVLDTIIGIQAGGVFNVLNGSITGAQIGGLFNVATENMSGLQAAGLFNYTHRNVKFAQVAGLMNLSQKVDGTQISGFLNVAREEVNGLQLSGFWNAVSGELKGVQIAGFTNVVKGDVSGIQMAGFTNVAGNVQGNQFAGFLNVSRDVNFQLAPYNIAKEVDGIQLGIINFSDTSAGSFGFLSFSKKGMNNLDIAADEVHFVNASYRTGSNIFYNILQMGFGSYEAINLWSYGYGIGTKLLSPKKRVNVHLELLARQIMDPAKSSSLNLNSRFEPSMSVKLAKNRPAIVFGPSFNAIIQTDQLQNTDPDKGPILPQAPPTYPPIFKEQTSVVDVRFWVGARVGLRI